MSTVEVGTSTRRITARSNTILPQVRTFFSVSLTSDHEQTNLISRPCRPSAVENPEVIQHDEPWAAGPIPELTANGNNERPQAAVLRCATPVSCLDDGLLLMNAAKTPENDHHPVTASNNDYRNFSRSVHNDDTLNFVSNVCNPTNIKTRVAERNANKSIRKLINPAIMKNRKCFSNG